MTTLSFGQFTRNVLDSEDVDVLSRVIHIGPGPADIAPQYSPLVPAHVYWVEPILEYRSIAEYHNLSGVDYPWTWIPRAISTHDGILRVKHNGKYLAAKCNTISGLLSDFNIKARHIDLLYIGTNKVRLSISPLRKFLKAVIIHRPDRHILGQLAVHSFYPKYENGPYIACTDIHKE